MSEAPMEYLGSNAAVRFATSRVSPAAELMLK